MSRRGKFLITGCGHQGTGWMARAMTTLGHPTGHEWVYGIGDDHPWVDQEGESSWLAGALVNKITDPMPILHLTRHPMDVVTSVHDSNFLRSECTCGHEVDAHRTEPYVQYVLRFFPDIWDVTPDLARAVAWVVMWNRIVETHGKGHFYKRFQIEQMSSDPDVLIAATTFLTGVAPKRSSVELVQATIPRNVNTHRVNHDQVVRMDDLPSGYWGDQLAMMTNDYGYGDADGY